MAFKMKAGAEGPMKKNFPGAFKKSEDKDKHAGGVLGGKQNKGDIVTNQRDVAMRRINALNISEEMKKRMIKELNIESMGQRTTGKRN